MSFQPVPESARHDGRGNPIPPAAELLALKAKICDLVQKAPDNAALGSYVRQLAADLVLDQPGPEVDPPPGWQSNR